MNTPQETPAAGLGRRQRETLTWLIEQETDYTSFIPWHAGYYGLKQSAVERSCRSHSLRRLEARGLVRRRSPINGVTTHVELLASRR